MPKRQDIRKILILGAGPIVIGQGCEFDYSGTQACKALREEGYEVALVNSNPATIMTDPSLADATYIEPITWESVQRVIERERPDAILPTMGGQTALNCALDLVQHGVLEKYRVEMIGANKEAIDKAEDRELFRKAMEKIGLEMPRAMVVNTFEEALQAQLQVGFPTVIRPSFTLGGSGGGIAYNIEEFEEICTRGLALSPIHELLVEESIIGWKEFEMEVVRDKNDNCIIVCAIENLDPMGIHTGDSITVAPAQTLTDKEYQRMRDASIAVLREIGIETGGSNVQFAINPKDGRLVVIEMNPRVSRSSALASKATGFPIAKVAAKLAIGYTLDELKNDITGGSIPASFEPSIDYVVTKIPRFNFEKFPQAETRLTTQMRSVGEVMAVGRTFQESFQKALRGLEIGLDGLQPFFEENNEIASQELKKALCSTPHERIWYVADGFRHGLLLEQIQQYTGIDPWFLDQIQDIVTTEKNLMGVMLDSLTSEALRALKRQGFSDRRLAQLLKSTEKEVRAKRYHYKIFPVFKRIDSCAGEFHSETAYFYSTYEDFCEANPTSRRKMMVLGSGPNRIGQGIEFDYCCVHAVLALKEAGFETIMVNCNPETVSTDYDTSDRLYFESLTFEDVMSIIDVEKPEAVIVQYGGQTPLKLARALEEAGVKVLGTSPDAIDRAEDRERFSHLIRELGLRQPNNATARTLDEGLVLAERLGFPLVVRPSYVLGGRAMEIVYNVDELKHYFETAVKVSNDSPVLLDRFLDDALEIDVDAICDGEDVYIGGIMQHIEEAGIHSGDSACSLPPFDLNLDVQREIRRQMRLMAKALGVIGVINAQFAVKEDLVYVLEVNPRASRTIPFVSKATGIPLVKVAVKCMTGITLREQNMLEDLEPEWFAVKEAVFPFAKFMGVDPILGPEMKSTGEVMGIGRSFAEAFSKSQLAAGDPIVQGGDAFITVRDRDKPAVVEIAKQLVELGFGIVATKGTAHVLEEAGIPCKRVKKVAEGRPHTVDLIKNREITFIVNTTEGREAIADSRLIRSSAVQYQVSHTTTLAGAKALIHALRHFRDPEVFRLQDGVRLNVIKDKVYEQNTDDGHGRKQTS